MSRKEVVEAVEALDPEALTPDLGATLKMLGEVLVKQWHKNNGIFLSADERKSRGKVPQAEVQQSDIQIRQGDWLYTIVPCDEDKAMVSIPAGLSDKVTPATIPKDWVIGFLIDALITLCEGDDYVARYWLNMMNNQINHAMQVDPESGRMKIDQKLLPEVRNPVEVAEMVDSLRRSFKSVSNPTTKTNFTFTATRLEAVETEPEPVVETKVDPGSQLIALADEISNSTPKEVKEVGEASIMAVTDPEPASVEAEDIPSPSATDTEEVVAVVADPTPPVDETIEIEKNPHNFKKNPTAWIMHELMKPDHIDYEWDIKEIAEHAGCHVQTIKRALETFEDEAHTVTKVSDASGHYVVPVVDKWVRLDISVDENHDLIITCLRSETGRFQRGRRIMFRIESISDQVDEVADDAEGQVDTTAGPVDLEELKVLKATDDTDPSLSPCPDCGTMTSHRDAPKEAPDFICGDCHLIRLDEDEQWYEESRIRSEMIELREGVELEEGQTQFEVIDTPVAAIEQTTGRCVHCAAPAKFTTMTAIGERAFCSEKCWAEYVGQPVMEEGHYGLQMLHDEAVSIEEELEEMRRLEDEYDFDRAMGV